MGPGCIEQGLGVAQHEFMHALGIHHEHTRMDRNDYVDINFDNIIPGKVMAMWTSTLITSYQVRS